MLLVPEITVIDQEVFGPELPVLRWVLYFPGVLLRGPVAYAANEEVYYWCATYKKAAIQASFHKRSTEFYLPYLEKGEYTFEEQDRKGDLFFVYKGTNMNAHPPDAFEIVCPGRLSRQELLARLRTSETLWSYDRYSALLVEATLSGLQVKVWNYAAKAWEDYVLDQKEVRFVDYAVDVKAAAWLMEDFLSKFGSWGRVLQRAPL